MTASTCRLSAQLLVLLAVAGCHSASDPPRGARDLGFVAMPRDASSADANGLVPGAHFDNCTSAAQCPAGDSCSVPGTDPPIDDPAAPSQCRPPCTTDADCVETTSVVTSALHCNTVDHFCFGYCGAGGFIADCNAPFGCHRYTTYHDGYCAHL